MSWTPPWRPIAGSGQSLALTAASTNYEFANAVSPQTYAVMISLAPAATAAYALVRTDGSAATATTDVMIKTTDPPLVLTIAPNTKVNVWTSAASGTAFLVELTH